MIRPSASSRARGFTLIELLVVIVVIALLAGIILVAVSGVWRDARVSSVEGTLSTIATGADAFQADFGGLPPLLAYDDSMWRIGDTPSQSVAERGVIVPSALQGPPNDRAVSALRRCRYGSEYTVGVYLFGAGDLNAKQGDQSSGQSPMGRNQGGNTDDDDGLAGAGIRAPGPDLSWGGSQDRLKHRANKIGRTYGPYLDASRFGEALAVEPESGLFKVLDAWNQPIRYYKSWPIRDQAGNNTSVLRTPVELRSERAVNENIVEGDPKLDLESEAINSRYTLLSAGQAQFFKPDGTPIPMFGDRRQPPNENTVTQNLSADFMVDQLGDDEQRELLEALRTNIRVNR